MLQIPTYAEWVDGLPDRRFYEIANHESAYGAACARIAAEAQRKACADACGSSDAAEEVFLTALVSDALPPWFEVFE